MIIFIVLAERKDTQKTMRIFKIPPGTYKVDVECTDGRRIRSQVFQIQAGKVVKVEVNCGSGKATMLSDVGGP